MPAGHPLRGLDALARDVRACRICRDEPSPRALPHEPRPVLRVSSRARIAVCGQAPGTRVHASGVPFTDPSGDRLRGWMGVTVAEFYDADRIAIVPMGFCFPGLDAKGGDLPPRRECATVWHARLFALMPRIELFLLVGLYAQAWHLDAQEPPSLSDTVADWRRYSGATQTRTHAGVHVFPLPHPSWRNNAWLKARPWFEVELLPELQQQVRSLLS